MKLPTNTVTVQSNMTYDETFKVGIANDDEAVAMVIERLISAYKNPYLATLREYTSNAYDEHVQAGVKRPVEVTLPNELSPVLKVQDFGRGLSREGLKGFGTIGKSTKRDSNDTTGGFGMGSKSALAAAPQFTVVSVKDGKRNTVIVARDENNIPHMNFLAETETEDESGTTIIVPISSSAKFGDLSNFWVGWPIGSVLVDDEAPKTSLFDASRFREIDGGIGYYDLNNATSGRDTIRIVINQVYYEINYRDLDLDYKQWNILKYYVIRLENGSVDIAPSRETLLFNARTKKAVAERTNALLLLARDEYARSVEAAPTLKAALDYRDKMYSAGYPIEGLKWQGKRILLPGESINQNQLPNPRGTWVNPVRAGHTKTGWIIEKQVGYLGDKKVWRDSGTWKFAIIHSASDISSYSTNGYRTREAHPEAFKVNDWLNSMSDAAQHGWTIFITSEKFDRLNKVYLDIADVLISGEDFNAAAAAARLERLRLEREARVAGQKTTKLKVFRSSSSGRANIQEMTVEDIADNYKSTVIMRNQESSLESLIRSSIATQVGYAGSIYKFVSNLMQWGSVAVIFVNKGDKIDDLLPLLPNVTTFEKLAVARVRETYRDATVPQRMSVRDRNSESIQAIQYLSQDWINKIKRKKTREWADAVRNYRDNGVEVRNVMQTMATYMPELKTELDAFTNSVNKRTALPESPIHRYPLLKSVYAGTNEELHKSMVEYINMMDAANKG